MSLTQADPGNALSAEDFEFFRDALKMKAGISLSGTKRGLIHSRLRSTLIDLGLSDYSAYRSLLESKPASDPVWQNFVEMLTTNKTDFFREENHFKYLSDQVLKNWDAKKPLNIWSAACSTGEEPYTLAMVLDRYLPAGTRFEILSTDIDSQVLEKAASGVYPASRIREQIPQDYLANAVDFGSAGIEKWARIKPRLKQHVKFETHNLIDTANPAENAFEIIFLRNVLIYFSPETIRDVVEKLYKAAKPGALLFISHSESLNSIKTQWQSIAPSIYRKPL